VRELQPGDVLYIYCIYIKPPSYKYIVCICPEPPLFFFINTESRRKTPDANVLVEKTELPCLSHDSYIDTATPITFSPHDLKSANLKGDLPESVRERIKDAVTKHNYLAPRYIEKILNNL